MFNRKFNCCEIERSLTKEKKLGRNRKRQRKWTKFLVLSAWKMPENWNFNTMSGANKSGQIHFESLITQSGTIQHTTNRVARANFPEMKKKKSFTAGAPWHLFTDQSRKKNLCSIPHIHAPLGYRPSREENCPKILFGMTTWRGWGGNCEFFSPISH